MQVDIFTEQVCSTNSYKNHCAYTVLMRFGKVEREMYSVYPSAEKWEVELVALTVALNELKRHDMSVRLYTEFDYLYELVSGYQECRMKGIWAKFNEVANKIDNFKIIKYKNKSEKVKLIGKELICPKC